MLLFDYVDGYGCVCLLIYLSGWLFVYVWFVVFCTCLFMCSVSCVYVLVWFMCVYLSINACNWLVMYMCVYMCTCSCMYVFLIY